MTTSRKIVIVLCAIFVGYVGFCYFDDRRAISRLESVREALAVGDAAAKVERVMREKGFDPNFSAKDNCYIAIVQLRHKRDAIMFVRLDSSSKITGIEIRTRMWM